MDLLTIIISFFIGMAVIYFTAYTKAKGKNKALKEDVEKLEDDKQRIAAKYRAETESLKKQHSLDIEKRKYQYDEKRNQFSKYFTFLDTFHNKCNSVYGERFMPVMSEFMGAYLNEDEEIKHQATVKYNEEVQKIFWDLNEEYLRVKTETNTIRLISSPEIDNFLNQLEALIKLATDQSTEILTFMSKPEFWADPTLMFPYQAKSEITGKQILECRDQIRKQMKLELNEI
jgi:hypothetical protein